MNSFCKYALGVLSLVPILGSLYAMVRVFGMIAQVVEGGGVVQPESMFSIVPGFMVVQFVGMLVFVLLLAVFLWHLLAYSRNKDPNHQLLWGVLLAVVGPIVMPIYWYLNILHEDPVGKPEMRPEVE